MFVTLVNKVRNRLKSWRFFVDSLVDKFCDKLLLVNEFSGNFIQSLLTTFTYERTCQQGCHSFFLSLCEKTAAPIGTAAIVLLV